MAQKENVALRLHAAAIHLLRTLRNEDRSMGLTPARASVLSVLVFGGPRTLSQLTHAEQVAAPTMTKLIAGLERDGLARREPGSDGRVWIIHPTAKARRLLLKGRQRRVNRLNQMLADLSPAEWRTLDEAVAILERQR